MNSDQLANQILAVCLEAGERVRGIGDAQYSKPHETESEDIQRHEEETLEDHLQGLEEELMDTINWAGMSILKLRERLAQAHSDT